MIVFVAGCSTLPQPVFSPDQPHLKVITYNVNWGFVKPDNVVDFLAGSDADVICLQETHKQWEAVLKHRLEERYPYCVFREEGGAGGIAVMSKYKLSSITFLEPTAGWFPALLVEVQTPIGLLQFLNVHLRPPLSDRGSANASAYYNTPDIHQKELQDFIVKADSQKPLIITGDFNEDEKGKAVRWLLEQGFADTLSMYDFYSKTWEWKVFYGVTLKNRYDHIIISEHLKCTGACVMRVKASDHMPVLAVIVLKNPDMNQCYAVR
jgi:endonuclease/exonuclease/phosphatase family metal-dependent hydrolase